MPHCYLTHECSSDHFCASSCKVRSWVPHQGFLNSITSYLLFRLCSESISERLTAACWEVLLVSTAGDDPDAGCQGLVPQTVHLGCTIMSPPSFGPSVLADSARLPCSALLLSVPVPHCHLFSDPGSALISDGQVTLS